MTSFVNTAVAAFLLFTSLTDAFSSPSTRFGLTKKSSKMAVNMVMDPSQHLPSALDFLSSFSTSNMLADIDVDSLTSAVDTIQASASDAVTAVSSTPDTAVDVAASASPEPSYSKASYYTTLGLYVLSFPGIWSQIKRSTKAKLKRKTYVR